MRSKRALIARPSDASRVRFFATLRMTAQYPHGARKICASFCRARNPTPYSVNNLEGIRMEPHRDAFFVKVLVLIFALIASPQLFAQGKEPGMLQQNTAYRT